MSLTKYKKKRNFKESPEPQSGKPTGSQLRFVIQKHDASRLHYDFRLEMDGVLKSWAVPKGPSTDPKVKRLAMMVEDHPYDYRNFEGIIPSGYGAGTVMVWDEGFYEPIEEIKGKKAQEKDLLQQLKSGSLKIKLHGEKLNGEFALVKTKGMGDNAWLLIKHKDEFASTKDITKKDKSVISDLNLKGIEKEFEEEEEEESKKKATKKTTAKKTISKKATSATKEKKTIKKKNKPDLKLDKNTEDLLQNAPTIKFPSKLKPMLATLIDKPFDKAGWIYEVKWDGYRALAFLNKGEVELKSRNDKSFNDKFYPITEALQSLNFNTILDGEIVVVNEKGISDFGALQNWRSEADGMLIYYVFDILWLEGKELTQLPLSDRKKILNEVIIETDQIKISTAFEESGITFFETAKKMELEGIMTKKLDSIYHPGDRSKNWLKIKAAKRQEMVIGGYTVNDDTSKVFSSLLVGVFDKKKLIYKGKVGTGFNAKMQKEMMTAFNKIERTTSPFTELPDINKPSRFRPNPPHTTVTWLKPELICEVAFAEMTTDGVMRHPSFQGMREDKKASTVVLEEAKPTEKIVKNAKKTSSKEIVKPIKNSGRKTLLNPSEETQVKKINGKELKFTNLSKYYWPDEKITKRDLINYYYQVAPYILPYLKGRPQSMLRHPNGIKGPSFFYKNVLGKVPDWVETYEYDSDADDKEREYLIATDEASLLYMASLGCIEMNPWSSTAKKEDYPTWCIIDLDPSAKTTFDQVIEAALVTKDILDEMGVPSYPKTSGSTGIHVYIPLGAKYTYEQSKEFARIIARMVTEQLPKFTSIERTVKDRKGKMYIDFLQNRPQATVSAPYSLRPKPRATVSMPLEWSEVKKGLKMKDFTIHNALERIKSVGDIFKPVLGKGINLIKVLDNF